MCICLSLAAALPGAACAGPGGLSGGKHNTKAPIEVTSDSLEVLQEDNKAIFTGHVVVIQGKVRLKADKMTVHYAGKQDSQKKPEPKKTKEAGKGDNPETAIKKIEAEGSVFLSTPMETASGASGVYDVDRQEIRLNDNVVLTRGKNVLKGSRLTYSFATGKSSLTGGSKPPGGNGKNERVRALFVPENNKEKE